MYIFTYVCVCVCVFVSAAVRNVYVYPSIDVYVHHIYAYLYLMSGGPSRGPGRPRKPPGAVLVRGVAGATCHACIPTN